MVDSVNHESTHVIFVREERLYRSANLPDVICASDKGLEESLLVLQGLGVQTSTTSSYFFLGPTTTFIPTTQIQDVVIHEAFKGFEVRFFLAIIVVGAPEVVVVFPVRAFLHLKRFG